MPSGLFERVLWCGVVLEPDNGIAVFYFVINAHISHVIITLIRYFLIPKSRDLVCHNPGISVLKNNNHISIIVRSNVLLFLPQYGET